MIPFSWFPGLLSVSLIPSPNTPRHPSTGRNTPAWGHTCVQGLTCAVGAASPSPPGQGRPPRGRHPWGQLPGLGRQAWLPGPDNHVCQGWNKGGPGAQKHQGLGWAAGSGEAWRLPQGKVAAQPFGAGTEVPDTPPWGSRSGPGAKGWMNQGEEAGELGKGLSCRQVFLPSIPTEAAGHRRMSSKKADPKAASEKWLTSLPGAKPGAAAGESDPRSSTDLGRPLCSCQGCAQETLPSESGFQEISELGSGKPGQTCQPPRKAGQPATRPPERPEAPPVETPGQHHTDKLFACSGFILRGPCRGALSQSPCRHPRGW
ncbi:uncharacterized protein AAEQ78_016909 isoform 3-T3 [Lycaon pictus]